MKIKFHPAAIIEIYPDGQLEMFFAAPTFRFDSLKIALIKRMLKYEKTELVEELPPGEYRVHLTEFNWMSKIKFHCHLVPK